MNEQQAMKAIVVRQPWATLIALGVKMIETRPSPPNGPMRPEGVRGLPGLAVERGERIAVVAGADPSQIRRLGVELCTAGVDRSESIAVHKGLMEHGYTLEWASGATTIPLPLGVAVCTVTVEDALPIVDQVPTAGHLRAAEGSVWIDRTGHRHQTEFGPLPSLDEVPDQLLLGDFTPGRWGWLLTDVERCDPIPVKGKQGVFALPADLSEQLHPKAVVA